MKKEEEKVNEAKKVCEKEESVTLKELCLKDLEK